MRIDRGWRDALIRLGYVARGVMFLGIGGAGLAVSIGATARPRGALEVIRTVAGLPLGGVMLVALALGLLGYAVLNLAGAVRDPFRYGGGVRGWASRGADAAAGAVYVALTAASVRLLAAPGDGAAPTAADWAARVLALPLGAVWLAVLGVALLATGAFLARKAVAHRFHRRLDARALRGWPLRATVGAARLGTAARAGLFALCGASALGAAVRGEPERVADIAGGLETLGRGTLGPLVLGVASAAFVAYGAYQFVKARHRVIELD